MLLTISRVCVWGGKESQVGLEKPGGKHTQGSHTQLTQAFFMYAIREGGGAGEPVPHYPVNDC